MTVQPGLARYGSAEALPPLVAAAVEKARAIGFDKACTPEVGALLRVLAASAEHAAETGTACGVGAAWLAAGLRPSARLVTVETDARLAAAAREVLAADERVTVVQDDARSALRGHAPFDLLFADGGLPKDEPDAILELVRPGGTVVLDDLTPEHAWPESLRRKFPLGDPVRRAWSRPDVDRCEIGVAANENVLLVVRR